MAHKFEVNRWWTCCLIAVGTALTLYLTIYVWRHVLPDTPRGDFTYFLTASQAMTRGQDIYAAMPTDRTRAGYIYPPLIAFLYQPLTQLSLMTAERISLLVNMTAIVISVAFGAKAMLTRLGRNGPWQVVLAIAVIAALLSADKIKGEVQMLQTNALITVGITLGFYFLDRRPFWAGMALGFAMNIKYQAIALLIYLLMRKRWKATGAMIVGTLFWAFLPAISVGFVREANYLAQGFEGVLRLVGLNFGNDVANVEPLDSGFSISVTSAIARFTERHSITASPLLLSGFVAIVWLLLLAAMVKLNRLNVFQWPKDSKQHTPPWDLMVAVEWVAVIASVLAFSPQTNMRHIVLTTLINLLGVALAWEGRGKNRWLAILALTILWCGLNLPLGQRIDGKVVPFVAWWHKVGGPTWTILVAMGIIAWVGFAMAKEKTLAFTSNSPETLPSTA